jgi:hypothetical protein
MLFRKRRSLHGPAILSDQTVAPSQKSQGRRALPPQQTNHCLLVQRISPSHFFSELGPRGVPQISSSHYSTDYILRRAVLGGFVGCRASLHSLATVFEQDFASLPRNRRALSYICWPGSTQAGKSTRRTFGANQGAEFSYAAFDDEPERNDAADEACAGVRDHDGPTEISVC